MRNPFGNCHQDNRRILKEVDRLANEVYKLAEQVCKMADHDVPLPLNFITVVLAMMRMVMEVVMVIVVVAGMVFMMKVSANENKLDKTVRDYGDDAEKNDETDKKNE
ncbi:hypothetical protein CRENPOLYSF2_2700005 [Crenothrix polyspora]|uniref:Uncharacterized protein n=1 Tax=Crenothrix polyspora TaxID=360316 RepID=A0A1R4H8S1_9GAMM|nr:hypothetical protein [Crenothrix polyspora]SJM92431.1 hypothetical protein CRENPOLYSF2_2700005 [Crenothrix polyspora]